MTLLLAVGVAGGLGALARFLLDGAVSTTVAAEFPTGTFVVNVSGALVLGLVVGASLEGDALTIAAHRHARLVHDLLHLDARVAAPG